MTLKRIRGVSQSSETQFCQQRNAVSISATTATSHTTPHRTAAELQWSPQHIRPHLGRLKDCAEAAARILHQPLVVCNFMVGLLLLSKEAYEAVSDLTISLIDLGFCLSYNLFANLMNFPGLGQASKGI